MLRVLDFVMLCLLIQTDTKAQVIAMTYDNVGRLIRRYDP
ncbi:hypothetical protein RHSA111115_03650 [Rheinheimera salexigens]